MGVAISQRVDTSEMPAKIGNIQTQFPSFEAAKAAMKGPLNDETALMTWPAVSELERARLSTTFVSSGLSDTCRIVLPMPSRAKATRQAANE